MYVCINIYIHIYIFVYILYTYIEYIKYILLYINEKLKFN